MLNVKLYEITAAFNFSPRARNNMINITCAIPIIIYYCIYFFLKEHLHSNLPTYYNIVDYPRDCHCVGKFVTRFVSVSLNSSSQKKKILIKYYHLHGNSFTQFHIIRYYNKTYLTYVYSICRGIPKRSFAISIFVSHRTVWSTFYNKDV